MPSLIACFLSEPTMTTKTAPFARPSTQPDFLEGQEEPSGKDAMLLQLRGERQPFAESEHEAERARRPATPLKPSRVAVFVTEDERYELHRRALDERVTLNDYLHSQLFPKGRKRA